MYAQTLSLHCRIWLKYFYIFAVMKQARRTFVPLGTWWLPKRPPVGANGNSKLIYALLFILLIPCKDLGRMKNYTFLKIILLYIVATMTSDSTGNGCGPLIILRWPRGASVLSRWPKSSGGGVTTTQKGKIMEAIHTFVA